MAINPKKLKKFKTFIRVKKGYAFQDNKTRITSSDQREGEINRKETTQHQRKTKD